MWLAHHAAEHHDRCVLVGSRPVCRRCLVLYPLCVVAVAAQLAGVVPARTGLWVMWLAPIPVVAEWVLEQFGVVAYSPWRQVATSLLAAPALGIALGRHIEHPFAAAALSPMLTAGSICLGTWWLATRRDALDDEAAGADWAARFERDEAERLTKLRARPYTGSQLLDES